MHLVVTSTQFLFLLFLYDALGVPYILHTIFFQSYNCIGTWGEKAGHRRWIYVFESY